MMRTAVTESMCFWISAAIFLWSSSCSIPRVSANPGVSRMRTWGEVTCTHYAQCADTYHYAVFAREFVKPGRLGVTLVARTTLLIAAVEDFKIVAINIVANKDIGEEFQE